MHHIFKFLPVNTVIYNMMLSISQSFKYDYAIFIRTLAPRMLEHRINMIEQKLLPPETKLANKESHDNFHIRISARALCFTSLTFLAFSLITEYVLTPMTITPEKRIQLFDMFAGASYVGFWILMLLAAVKAIRTYCPGEHSNNKWKLEKEVKNLQQFSRHILELKPLEIKIETHQNNSVDNKATTESKLSVSLVEESGTEIPLSLVRTTTRVPDTSSLLDPGAGIPSRSKLLPQPNILKESEAEAQGVHFF